MLRFFDAKLLQMTDCKECGGYFVVHTDELCNNYNCGICRPPSRAGKTKKAAQQGPVFITDRGRPAHVLLTIDQYRQLTGRGENLIDLLAMPGAEEVEFEPARSGLIFRPADLS